MEQRIRPLISPQPSRARSCGKVSRPSTVKALFSRILWPAVALGLVTLAAGATALAQTSASSGLAEPRPTVTIPRVNTAPRLSDFLGMEPDATMAGKMLHIDGFIQRTPKDNVAPNQRTDVYLGYDSNYLYVVFVAFDNEPNKVRAHMTVRDHLSGDERLDLFLDTFHDHRHAYVFTVNPFGLQQDGSYEENASPNYDSSFDTVWKSKGRRTKRGFVVWEAIPFKSLRFPATPKQTWGVLFIRWIPRNNGS